MREEIDRISLRVLTTTPAQILSLKATYKRKDPAHILKHLNKINNKRGLKSRKQLTINNLGMAAVTMVQPPPPSSRNSSSRSCTTRSPPPPPPPGARDRHSNGNSRSSGSKRSNDFTSQSKKNVRQRVVSTLKFPKPLRDVTVFEKKNQVGQGTYGSVFVGADKKNGDIVALKRINTEQEENGFPITAIREVAILKALSHPNIVTLKEIVTSKGHGEIPKNVFMVFEYLEYDLTGVLETHEIRLSQDHIKSWSYQLLSGVHYMHKNKIIHRDLKASNLLISKNGDLKIADWGLARSWNKDMRNLTKKVITLWYRPPELLLGNSRYSPKIDMWSVGCIIAEMFRRSGFLKGRNETEQLNLIFNAAGHPTPKDWPNIEEKCPLWKNYKPNDGELLPRRIKEKLQEQLHNSSWLTKDAIYLIDKLLALNPDHRWDAYDSLDAEYFFEDPIVKKSHQLNMKFSVTSVHEWEARKRHEEMMKKRQAQVSKKSANGSKTS